MAGVALPHKKQHSIANKKTTLGSVMFHLRFIFSLLYCMIWINRNYISIAERMDNGNAKPR